MTKHTKAILSKEACGRELKRQYQAVLPAYLIFLFTSLIIFLPLAVFCVGEAVKLFQQSVIGAMIGIFGSLVLVSPIVVFIGLVWARLSLLNRIEKGEFFIVQDEVSEMVDGEIVGRHSVKVLYFSRCGRYITEGSVFDYTSVGDAFYVVTLNTQKPKPLLAYHTKIYDLQS